MLSVRDGARIRRVATANDPGSRRADRSAYGELLALFPQKNERNRAAFFDYLCEMDFIERRAATR